MSGEMDNVQQQLQTLAQDTSNPDAIKIIGALSSSLDAMRNDLLYERLEEPSLIPESEVSAFKQRVYAELKGERATDLAIAYNREFFAELKPATRLAIVQALTTIAKEQKIKMPELWQHILDSRGHF